MKMIPVSSVIRGRAGASAGGMGEILCFVISFSDSPREFSAKSSHQQRCLACGSPSEHPFLRKVWEAQGTAAGEAGVCARPLGEARRLLQAPVGIAHPEAGVPAPGAPFPL